MCTVLVTIVGQTINVALNPSNQVVHAKQSDSSILQSTQPSDTHSPKNLTNELNAHVNKQKDKLNTWIKTMVGENQGTNTSSAQVKNVEKPQDAQGFEYHREEPHTHTEHEYDEHSRRDYAPFMVLHENLKAKSCKYDLPVDNADPPLRQVIQW